MPSRVSEMLSAATWSGAGLSAIGAVTLMQWLAVGGFLLACAGFGVNLWHKRKMINLAERRLELDISNAKQKDL